MGGRAGVVSPAARRLVAYVVIYWYKYNRYHVDNRPCIIILIIPVNAGIGQQPLIIKPYGDKYNAEEKH